MLDSPRQAGFQKTAVLLLLSFLAEQTSAESAQSLDYHGSVLPGSRPMYAIDSYYPVWPGALIEWYYNPAGQPIDVSTDQIVAVIENAARKWEDVCNVDFVYLGTTSAAPDIDASFTTIDRANVIGWRLLTGDKAGFSGYTAWWYELGDPATLVDSDTIINTQASPRFNASNLDDLGALMTHEFGHMLAIEHSDQVQSVMFANPYHSYHFQSTLRGDDVAACAALYGASPNSRANRLFNWAEQVYSDSFAPVGVTSQDGFGYHFRYYSDSYSYLGTKNGRIYYLVEGGDIQDLGSIEDFWNDATMDGF